MIISETILIEKFSESDDKGYDYLIDNAESDEQVSVLQSLRVGAKSPLLQVWDG
jgi:hypothetical protein